MIYEVLLSVPELQEHTAYYDAKPAIFYQQLPNDKDEKWEQWYPCVSYGVDWRYNTERKTNGYMAVDIYCSNTSKIAPEDLAMGVIRELSELFLTEDDKSTYCFLWDNMSSFEVQKKEPVVTGVTVTFDIIAFPNQEASVPSPVWSVNQFIEVFQPNCVLIGHDTLPKLLKATKEHPLIYVSKKDTKLISTSYAMAWIQETLHISVLSSDITETKKWVDALIRDLGIERETTMQNGSPFLIMQMSESSDTDPLKTGQISLIGEYGVLRKEKEKIKLNHAIFEGGERNG